MAAACDFARKRSRGPFVTEECTAGTEENARYSGSIAIAFVFFVYHLSSSSSCLIFQPQRNRISLLFGDCSPEILLATGLLHLWYAAS
jgi:hypothetical protein